MGEIVFALAVWLIGLLIVGIVLFASVAAAVNTNELKKEMNEIKALLKKQLADAAEGMSESGQGASDGNADDGEGESCPACGEPVKPTDEVCPSCELTLTPSETQ